MKEYIERDAAVSAVMDKPDLTADEKISIVHRIGAIPAVAVAPVVRCKDCAWWGAIYPNDGHRAEPSWRNCLYFDRKMEGEDFCSYAAATREGLK